MIMTTWPTSQPTKWPPLPLLPRSIDSSHQSAKQEERRYLSISWFDFNIIVVLFLFFLAFTVFFSSSFVRSFFDLFVFFFFFKGTKTYTDDFFLAKLTREDRSEPQKTAKRPLTGAKTISKCRDLCARRFFCSRPTKSLPPSLSLLTLFSPSSFFLFFLYSFKSILNLIWTYLVILFIIK